MRWPRRILIVLGILLVAGTLVALWIRSGQGRVSVGLVFVGFTNTVLTSVSDPRVEISFPMAKMLVTNNGAVPVILSGTFRPTTLLARGFVPVGLQPAQVLRPGEFLLVEVGPGDFSSPWRTGLSYQRHGLAERVYDRVWTAGGSSLHKVINSVMSGPALVLVESGWITNQAPRDQAITWSHVPVPATLTSTQVLLWTRPNVIRLPASPFVGRYYPAPVRMAPIDPDLLRPYDWQRPLPSPTRSDVIPWPSTPVGGRHYHITAPPEVDPIRLP